MRAMPHASRPVVPRRSAWRARRVVVRSARRAGSRAPALGFAGAPRAPRRRRVASPPARLRRALAQDERLEVADRLDEALARRHRRILVLDREDTGVADELQLG